MTEKENPDYRDVPMHRALAEKRLLAAGMHLGFLVDNVESENTREQMIEARQLLQDALALLRQS